MSTGAGRKWDEGGAHFKQGKFSRAETETVVDAVKTYAMTHQIPVEVLCSEGCRKQRGAWMDIADCLPERTVQAIYRHGKRKLHGLKRGAWTKEEESELISLVEEHGNKWIVIEKLLGRPADTCRDKYREYVTDPATGQWTEEEEKLLEQAVMEKIHNQGNKLVSIQEKTDMDWAEVAKRVGTRNRISCLKKWDDVKGKRLKKRLLSEAGSKLSLRLSIAREVLNTGARHETEVVWTKLPCPRAHRYWLTLRKGFPSTLPLDEVAREVIRRLEGKMAQVGSGDPVTAEPKDILVLSIKSCMPSPSNSRKCNADQSSTGEGSESGLRLDLRAHVEGASGDDEASSRSTGAGICMNHELYELAPTTSSPQKRSNGSETRLESAIQDDARREALDLPRDVSNGSSAEESIPRDIRPECGETLKVGRRSPKKKKRKKDKGSRDGDKDNRRKREKGGSADRTRDRKINKSKTDQRSPLQAGGEATLWETLPGTEGLASPPLTNWTELDAGFSAIFGLGPGPAQCAASGASPSEATAPKPPKGAEPLNETRPPESLESRSPSEVEKDRRKSKLKRMLCSVAEDND